MNGEATVCTLFEGDYHYGVGALANSLHAVGYTGTFWVGYRGTLPFWTRSATQAGGVSTLKLSESFSLSFVPIETQMHLAMFKPAFIDAVTRVWAPTSRGVYYFDPDITVRCPWSFFESWLEHGVALCEDVRSPMEPTHPLRMAWVKAICDEQTRAPSAIRAYVNSGFIGVPRSAAALLSLWEKAIALAMQGKEEAAGIKYGERWQTFQVPDQDALNASLYCSAFPLSIAGKDAMDFAPGGYVMSHAIEKPKPWRRNPLVEALHGVPPSSAEKAYWRNVESPIRLYSTAARACRTIALIASAAIGRFYRRV